MAEVAYRFTFLDVLCEDEERAQDIRSGRARSEPPLGLGRQPCLSPEEAELQLYVRSLPGGITGGTPDSVQGQAEEALLSSEEAEMASYVQRESRAQPHPESITVDGPNLNMGSLGHPLLCKRPCVHVSAGRRCEAGASCDFCHLCDGHGLRLDKQQRRMVANMSKAEFLYSAIHLLKDQAQKSELRGADAVLAIFEDELRSDSQNDRDPPEAPPQRLLRSLRRANFTAIASLAAQKCSEDSRTQMFEALQALRASV